MLGYGMGRELARSLELHPPVDMAPVLRELGLQVTGWRFRGRLREIIMEGVIGIDARLPEPWARRLTAHAGGHHGLHAGANFHLDSWQWVNRVKAQRQAEEFAAGLLVPPAGALEGLGPAATRALR